MQSQKAVPPWIETACIALGALAVTLALIGLADSLASLGKLPLGSMSGPNILWAAFGALASPAAFFAFGVWAIRRRQTIASRCAEAGSGAMPVWESAAYRLAFAAAGAAFGAWALSGLKQPLIDYALRNHPLGDNFIPARAVIAVIGVAFRCGIGACLADAGKRIAAWRASAGGVYGPKPVDPQQPPQNAPVENSPACVPYIRAASVAIGLFVLYRAMALLAQLAPIAWMTFVILKDSISDRGAGDERLNQELIQTLSVMGFFTVSVIVWFAVAFWLIVYSPSIATRLASKADSQTLAWEYAAYRLAFVFGGLWIVSGMLSWAMIAFNPFFETTAMRMSGWVTIAALIVQGAFCAYMIAGSGRIARWQTHR